MSIPISAKEHNSRLFFTIKSRLSLTKYVKQTTKPVKPGPYRTVQRLFSTISKSKNHKSNPNRIEHGALELGGEEEQDKEDRRDEEEVPQQQLRLVPREEDGEERQRQ